MRTEHKVSWIFAFVLALLSPATGGSALAGEAVLYKDPACGCCAEYAKYLETNGFAVKVVETADLAAVKAENGVPEIFAACHTLVVDGYVVEGHVPVSVLNKLLSEKPKIKGISLPGMPPGSPGMGGSKSAPFVIYEISGGAPHVYTVN